jgi:hypothetical protein
VSNRSLSLMSAASALALLPLAMTNSTATTTAGIPVTIDFRVVTATTTLNLAALTPDDFGDNDTVR